LTLNTVALPHFVNETVELCALPWASFEVILSYGFFPDTIKPW